MNKLLCPILPFPNIYWWAQVLNHQQVILEAKEYYEKMSFRNRYLIASSQGLMRLSIPLKEGRAQRNVMDQIAIDNTVPWQKQHWHSLVNCYNRSPYFEYYSTVLEPLFHSQYVLLLDFNWATIQLLAQLLQLSIDFSWTQQYQGSIPENTHDIRASFLAKNYLKANQATYAPYMQVFGERHGFLANLSILDLLFTEGPQSKHLIQKTIIS